MEQQKTFIKFIIPCWGVQSTIGRMLDSILKQTFADYHIVCVDDCSPERTWDVLQQYKERFPDKITLIKNQKNLGAGASRNNGVEQTHDSVPSEFLWVVDGDDYIADENVLKDIHDFSEQNPNLDIINIGISYCGKYSVGEVGWPIASWGRVIRESAYVKSPELNIPKGNDVYPHFVMFDQVDDSRIGQFNRKCYVCPKAGGHQNHTEKNMNSPKTVGDLLMQYQFRKQSVVDAMNRNKSGTCKWLMSANPDFRLTVKRNVSILMASFPYRKKWMLQCIERLMPQCDNFYLWLNEYKEIPEELKKYDQNKLHITLGDVNLKENGRYTFLTKPELQDDYCFICDDDIVWPKDYVKKTLECFKRHGDRIVIAYFINGGLADFHAKDKVQTGYSVIQSIAHYRFGAGTCAFVPGLIKFKFTYDELAAHYDIELFFAQQCINDGIKLYSPERQAKWIQFIKDGEIERHALSRNGFIQRISKTCQYMKGCNRFYGKQNTTNKNPVKFKQVLRSMHDNRKFYFG